VKLTLIPVLRLFELDRASRSQHQAVFRDRMNLRRHDRLRQDWHRKSFIRGRTNFSKPRGRDDRIWRALHLGQRSLLEYFI
jgi:hypothetical protein